MQEHMFSSRSPHTPYRCFGIFSEGIRPKRIARNRAESLGLPFKSGRIEITLEKEHWTMSVNPRSSSTEILKKIGCGKLFNEKGGVK